MAEQEGAEPSIVDQYEIGDETTVVETPVSESPPPTIETTPRDSQGRFVSTSTPEATTPSHPAYLVRMAEGLGFTKDEIAGIPPEALGLAVAKVNEVRRQDERTASIERTHHEARQAAPPPDAAPKDDFDLSSEEFDDRLVKVLKRQEKDLQALRAELNQLRTSELIRHNETLTQKMDRLFAKNPKLFGEGPGKKLPKDSPELKRRLAVLRDMDTIGSGDEEERYEKSLDALYPESKVKPPEPPPDKALEERKEQWNRGGVARPTHRNGAPEPKGRHKAEQSVESLLKEMGSSGSEETTSPDEFLGE